MTRDNLAWIAVTVLLAACALLGQALPTERIDWQPGLFVQQPWRAFSAVGVHYSSAHLWGNLAGVALAGVFGVVAQVPARLSLAWLVAWPLTHVGLLLRPELAHYGGLSGVVHAGVAATIVSVWMEGDRRQRIVASLVTLGFMGKLLSETPWGPILRHPAGWDIAVAPFVHTTGAVAGAVCAAGVLLFLRPQDTDSP